jgi:ribosomal protein S27E
MAEKKPTTRAKCRDCGNISLHYRYEFFQAGAVRCEKCGAQVDVITPLAYRRTSQRRR